MLPNTYSSLPNPLESSTSKESPMMTHNTVWNGERTKAATEVVDDNPKVNVYSVAKVSLQCNRCPFKTAELKQRKARRRLSTQHRNNHLLINITQDEVGHNETNKVAKEVVQKESMETASTTTKVSLQCNIETKQSPTAPLQPQMTLRWPGRLPTKNHLTLL